MDLKVFEGLRTRDGRNITAGLTRSPDLSDERRSKLSSELELAGGNLIRPCLVHGNSVEVIDRAFLDGRPSYIELEDTDGLVTDVSAAALTSTHGDCIPIFACCPESGVIGLAHAGWRGTLSGIAAELIGKMSEMGCRPEDISVYIGPGIGECCFEVGEDVADLFSRGLSFGEEYIKRSPGRKPRVDLKGINARLIELSGVRDIKISADCTCCGGEEYYSYRRNGDRRRMLSYIYMERKGGSDNA